MITDLILDVQERGADDAVDSLDVIRVSLEQIEDAAKATDRAFKAMNKGNGFGRTSKQLGRLSTSADKSTESVDKLAASFASSTTDAERLADAVEKIRQNQVRGPRGGGGGGGGGGGSPLQDTEKDVDAVTEALEKLRQNQALNKQLLASREYRQELRALAAQERELGRIQQSTGERFQETLETFENIEGAIGAVTLLADAVVGLFNAVQVGAQNADLTRALNVQGLRGAASDIEEALGGRLGGVQTGRLALRGLDRGLGGASQAAAARLGSIAGSQRQLTEGGDLREITVQLTQSIQDELAAGQIGEGLTAAGVNAGRFNEELRRLAAATGQQVNAIPAAVREQLLLAQAYEDSSANARIFRTSLQDGVAGVQVDLENFGNRVAQGLAEATQPGALGGRSVEQTRADLNSQRDIESLNPNQRGAGPSDGPSLAEQRLTAELQVAVARESAVVQRQLTAELEKQAQVIAFQRGDGAAFLEQRLEAVRTVRAERGALSANLDARSEEAAFVAEVLALQTGISEAEARALVTRVNLADLAQLEASLNAQLIPLKRQQLESEIARVQRQQQYTAGLTQEQRISLAREEAELRIRRSLIDRVGTLEELNDLVAGEVVQRRLSLEATQAELAEQAKLSVTLTEREQQLLKNRQALVDARLVISDSTSDVAEQNRLFGEAVAARVFGEAADQAQMIADQLGLSVNATALIRQNLGAGFAALDRVSGGLLSNSQLIANLFEDSSNNEPSTPTSRSGPDNRRAQENLIFQASLIGLNQAQQDRLKIERQFNDNLDVVRGNRAAEEANLRIRDTALDDVQRRVIAQDLRAAGEGLVRTLSLISDGVEGVGANITQGAAQGRERDAIQARFTEQQQIVGLQRAAGNAQDPAAQAAIEEELLQARLDALAREQGEQLQNESLTANQRLQIELDFLSRRQELRAEFASQEERRAQDEAARERERMQANAEFARSLVEQRAVDVLSTQQELAEQQRAAFEASLPEGVEVAGFEAFDSTTRSIIENVDRAALGVQFLADTMAIASDDSLDAIQKTSGIIGAFSQVTGGLIGNVKTRARVLGAFELAQAAADAASLNFIGAALHTLAATKFFALSGGGGGSGTTATTSTTRQQRQRTRFSTGDINGGLRNTQRQPQNIVNLFNNPVDGRAQVEALNELGRDNPNVQINQEVVRGTTGPTGL